MSLQTPTTEEINDNIIANLEASLNQTIPLLPKSFLRVLAKVLAAVFILLYKYAGFTFLQIFVATASNDETEVNGRAVIPLQFWGELIGVGAPTPAVQAELTIDITVTNQTGILPSGSQLISSATGVTYITLSAVSLNAATVQATIRAVADQSGGNGAGVIGNLENGSIVSFANPLANVAKEAVVVGQIIVGADEEATEVYRQRIIDRFQARPQGGALADYKIWGEEVAGIINVYPYTGDPGEVNVYSEATPESSGDPDGIPTAAQLDQVLDSIELDENGLATRRPANAAINSLPISRTDFTVDVIGLIVDNEAEVQQEIETALDNFFQNAEPFITGLSVTKSDVITKTAIGGIVYDVVNAAGGVFSDAVLREGGTVTTVYTLGEGEKAKISAVNFII